MLNQELSRAVLTILDRVVQSVPLVLGGVVDVEVEVGDVAARMSSPLPGVHAFARHRVHQRAHIAQETLDYGVVQVHARIDKKSGRTGVVPSAPRREGQRRGTV